MRSMTTSADSSTASMPASSKPASSKPALPDGLVVFVKRDCATCELVSPVLADLRERADALAVFTQDDPSFPDNLSDVIDDTTLEMSWHHDVETVPTVIRVVDGAEVDRTVGWKRTAWEELTSVVDLGADLPDQRPGCGSLSVDPDRTAALAAAFGNEVLRSRRVELASLEDDIEAMFDRGWSDGLPLVPPTEKRVMAMLGGTTRDPQEVITLAPPDLVECTVEKIAINAVMAGCKPEYLPVVIAAVEASCTDEFNMHGALCTTMGVGPIVVVNGPIRDRIGMNYGINALGQGNRANSTIGRALQLVIRNVGGGRPGEIDRAAQGQPGKLGMCFAEDEAGTPWESLAVDQGMDPTDSAVTVFCGEAPRIIVDQQSRTPESLTNLLAEALLPTCSPRMIYGVDAMLVLSPEHMARYVDAGWSKAKFREELLSRLQIQTDTVLAGHNGIDEGLPVEFGGAELPKFRPGGLLLTHAGGPAGLFSSVFGGWVSGAKGSIPVTKKIGS